MKQIKGLLAAGLALCLLLGLCACGSGNDAEVTTAPTAAPTQAPTIQKPTEEPTDPVEDDKVSYYVTVVDQDGNPVSGVLVQVCYEVCYPIMTDESGVAEFSVPEADYKVSILMLPEGYTFESEGEEIHFPAGSMELTLTLTAQTEDPAA